MIELVPIDSQLKLQTATEIQHRIFTCKGYDAYLNYKESGELYRCAEDPVSFQYDLMVYSKPLPGYAPLSWNNRNLHLQTQFVRQQLLTKNESD